MRHLSEFVLKDEQMDTFKGRVDYIIKKISKY